MLSRCVSPIDALYQGPDFRGSPSCSLSSAFLVALSRASLCPSALSWSYIRVEHRVAAIHPSHSLLIRSAPLAVSVHQCFVQSVSCGPPKQAHQCKPTRRPQICGHSCLYAPRQQLKAFDWRYSCSQAISRSISRAISLTSTSALACVFA